MPSASDLAAYAAQQLGKPYVFGNEGPNSFDCSGLMQFVFGRFGIKLPRVTGDQVKVGAAVPKDQIRPGDLVFSSWDGSPHSHVGMAVSGNRIINAPHSGSTVRYATLSSSYLSHVDAVRRLPGVDGTAGTTASGTSGPGVIPVGLPTPGDLVGAVRDAAGALGSIAEGVTTAGKLADQLLKLALPSNLTRAVAGAFGVGFLFVGIRFLVHEVRR